MKKRDVFRSLILASLVLVFWAAPALAYEPYLYFFHQTFSAIINGKSDYSDTQFDYVHMDVTDTDPALENVVLTIKNGSYSYGTWDNLLDAQPIRTIANTDFTFNTKYFSDDEAHVPVNDANEHLYFWGAADSGFSEKAFSYSLDGAVINGALPKIRATSEQLKSYVPYVEYVLNANNRVAALNISFTDPSNPAQTLIKTSEIDVELLERVNLWDQVDNLLGGNLINKRFADGDELKYQVILDNPPDPSEIDNVVVRFGLDYPSGNKVLYRWYFNAYYAETAETAETASYSTFIGEWEAIEGRARINRSSFPLKISESHLKIYASRDDKIMIDFYMYHEDKNNKKWYSGNGGRHEVERSALEGALPKTIKWQETHKLTRNGIPRNELFFYTVEFKDDSTISVRVFNKTADSTAIFKMKK